MRGVIALFFFYLIVRVIVNTLKFLPEALGKALNNNFSLLLCIRPYTRINHCLTNFSFVFSGLNKEITQTHQVT